jgi:metallo-beta-lactamase family protein
MCEHGRILHHLKHGIENERNAIVLVGFQAAHTLGRRLAEGERRVRIFGDWFERRAEVARLDAFSAHADRNDLIDYVERVRPRRTYLVHGEPDQRAALAEALRKRKRTDVFLPEKGETVELA